MSDAARGRLIIFTGINGSGKETISNSLLKLLADKGQTVERHYGPEICTATKKLYREVILADQDRLKEPYAVALGMYTVHAEVARIINQLVDEGKDVFLDRGPETTWVYNVSEPGLDKDFPELRMIYDSILDQLKPDLTILLDLPAEVATKRGRQQATTDYIQEHNLERHEARRQLYLDEARRQGDDWSIIDASQSIEAVVDDTYDAIKKVLKGNI